MPLLDVRDVVAYVRGAPLFAPLSFSADTGDVLVRWETPRLCRGGSRSLTDTGVHRGDSQT